MTAIELVGLELHGYHGVNEDERRDGQRFVFDIYLEVPDYTGASDRIEDTIDYREVAALVREISDGRAYMLLEALASSLAWSPLWAKLVAEVVVSAAKSFIHR